MGMMIANRKHLTNYKAHRAGEYLTLYLETSDLGLKSKYKITYYFKIQHNKAKKRIYSKPPLNRI